MKKPSPHLGVWARLFVFPASGNSRTAAVTLRHPQTIVPALIAALTICGVLGGISLFVPPFIENDTGYGFLAWRGTLLGAANSFITADPTNIAEDKVEFFTMFKPGLYMIPGAISLIMGVPLGIAMTLTVTLSLLACLVGWAMVVRAFAPRTSLALLVMVLIGSFRYSTSEFGIYHGGEILLQATTPWLVFDGLSRSANGSDLAALLSAGAVFLAFLAKLTGIIVVAAALVAGGLVCFAYGRGIHSQHDRRRYRGSGSSRHPLHHFSFERVDSGFRRELVVSSVV